MMLTVDFIVLVLTIFNRTDVECRSVRKYQATRYLSTDKIGTEENTNMHQTMIGARILYTYMHVKQLEIRIYSSYLQDHIASVLL